jgi:hypothetical protein
MRKKKWLGVIGGLLFLCVCFGVVGAVALGKIGYEEFLKSPRLTSVFANQEQTSIYQLSPDQQGYVNENGYPASFSILFYQEQGTSEQVEEVRYETWYYFNPDLKVTFVNGRFSAAEASELQGGVSRWNYRPEMFTAYMTPEQVAEAADFREWLIVPVEENLVAEAEVYYADGLTFGMKNGQLVYIEVFAGE